LGNDFFLATEDMSQMEVADQMTPLSLDGFLLLLLPLGAHGMQ